MTKPSVISLFTGAGGLDHGFHAAGFQVAAAVEMDAQCCETLRLNKHTRSDDQVLNRKVEDVASEEILAHSEFKPGEADVLVGGPPCQPFSKSGYWHRGDSARLEDPRANTLWEFLRVLRDTQPRAFLLENVAGLAYSGKSEGLDFIASELLRINDEIGTNYTFTLKTLNTASFGVPQMRERVVIVGSRDGTLFEFPNPRFFKPDDAQIEKQFPASKKYRTAWDALSRWKTAPPDLKETRVRGKWADLLPSIPEGANYLHHTDRGSGKALFGWRRRYWSFLLKLAKGRPSWTLTAQPGPAIGPFHWESRRLARRELSALQTFPSSHKWPASHSLSDVHRQVGNAVPSLLAEVLALEIRRQLLGHDVQSDSPTLLPKKKATTPEPEPVCKVPKKYLELVGDYDAHPGTGKGYGALRRKQAS